MQQFYETNYGSFTANGKKKSNNEDYYCNEIPEIAQDLLDLGSIFIVADGVGGAAHGELASKYAAELLRFEYYRKVNESIPERLRSGFKKATRDIYTYAEESGRFSKMATTMVAAVVVKNRLFVANVGDSRAYLIRNGNVRQITRDHSMVEEWVRDGIMTEEEARVSKKRNQLSRSIGGEPDVSVDIFEDIPLQIGDKILLCTDGLTRYARPEDIKRFCASGQPAEIAKTMVRFANQSGGADNTTVTLIEIVEQATHQKTPDTKESPRPDLKEWQKAETEYPDANLQRTREKTNPLLVILPMLAISIFLFSLYIFKGGGWDVLFGDNESSASLPINTDIPEEPTNYVAEEDTSSQMRIGGQQFPQQPMSDQSLDAQLPPEQDGLTNELPESVEDNNTKPSQTGDDVADKPWQCVYLYREKYFSGTLYNFGIQYNPDSRYFYYLDCLEQEGQPDIVEECNPENPIEILDPDHVEEYGVDKWILIYDSQKNGLNWEKSDCVSGGRNGKVYFYKNVGGEE